MKKACRQIQSRFARNLSDGFGVNIPKIHSSRQGLLHLWPLISGRRYLGEVMRAYASIARKSYDCHVRTGVGVAQ